MKGKISMKDMTPAGIAGQSRNWMYRMGGIASFTIGAAYILIIVLYAIAGAPPSGAEERLNDLAGKTGIWWAIVGVSVFTNFLYVPVSISLYFGLKDVNQIAMLIGAAFINLFVVLENAVNWTVYGALIVLSEGYASAAAESQRAIFVAAASFANAVLESPLAAVWAIGAISVGFLIIGLVMRKSSFGRPAAYMGILTGILGIAVVAGVDMAVIPNAVTATIWLFLVGYRLYRLV
jgi:hypothetical protein